MTYTVGGKEADQADFDAFLAEQETKLPALWYEYSADMLRLVLGQ